MDQSFILADGTASYMGCGVFALRQVDENTGEVQCVMIMESDLRKLLSAYDA